jgi:hypothetical protein
MAIRRKSCGSVPKKCRPPSQLPTSVSGSAKARPKAYPTRPAPRPVQRRGIEIEQREIGDQRGPEHRRRHRLRGKERRHRQPPHPRRIGQSRDQPRQPVRRAPHLAPAAASPPAAPAHHQHIAEITARAASSADRRQRPQPQRQPRPPPRPQPADAPPVHIGPGAFGQACSDIAPPAAPRPPRSSADWSQGSRPRSPSPNSQTPNSRARRRPPEDRRPSRARPQPEVKGHHTTCGRMSAFEMPATATGFFIASRRKGSPSS